MTLYIGTKVVNATPMTRGTYNEYRGWDLPIDEAGSDEGYMVEYLDGGKPNVQEHKGYISWSPKDVFENSYRSTGKGMSFGDAIVALKSGSKVARDGWNGKGMWLCLVKGGKKVTLRRDSPYAFHTGEESCEILSHIDMWTVNAEGRRAMLPGWLASQTDMLSDDWDIVL
jgi:Protein of unknown function (DUF2829).